MLINTPFKLVFKAEAFKITCNKYLIFLVFFPAIMAVVVSLFIMYKYNFSLEYFSPLGTINPWKNYLVKNVFGLYYILSPLIIAIFCHGCCDLEYKNNNLKILYTLPVNKSQLICSKLTVILLLILLSVLLSYFLLLLSGFALNIFTPRLEFRNYDFRMVIFYLYLKMFLSLSAVGMVQLNLSLIFKNFIYPIGFAIVMVVFALITYNSSSSDFNPYVGPLKIYLETFTESTQLERMDYSNLIATLFFALSSIFVFIKFTRA